jgi:Family of unknown function (DUF6165)
LILAAHLERGTMKLVVETSAGELLDKIAILEIKIESIHDEEKLANVRYECAALTATLDREIAPSDELSRLRAALKAVNAELWRIEDEIRAQEKAGTFGEAFVALARSVYRTNDRRAALKREINMLLQSTIVEEKSYADY